MRLDATGFVYFIAEEPITDMVKVGWAFDPAARLRTLQTGNPANLRLIAQARGPREAESWAHEQLKPWRVRGEWYRVPNLYDLPLYEMLGGTVADLVATAIEGSQFAGEPALPSSN